MFRSGHCLHTLLSDIKMTDIVLRSCETSFNLPQCNCKPNKPSFINRCLFRDCYWHVLLCFPLCVSHFHSAISYYHSVYFNRMAFVRLDKRNKYNYDVTMALLTYNYDSTAMRPLYDHSTAIRYYYYYYYYSFNTPKRQHSNTHIQKIHKHIYMTYIINRYSKKCM